SALNRTMHIEMPHHQKMQKALWRGRSRVGTRGADNPVGREPTRASNCNETAERNEDAALVCGESSRQTPRPLQAASVPVSLRALQVVVRRQRRAAWCAKADLRRRHAPHARRSSRTRRYICGWPMSCDAHRGGGAPAHERLERARSLATCGILRSLQGLYALTNEI